VDTAHRVPKLEYLRAAEVSETGRISQGARLPVRGGPPFRRVSMADDLSSCCGKTNGAIRRIGVATSIPEGQ
jgi:hypothetical protein